MSTRNIQFERADFGYLYGSCQFIVRPENKRYRISFGSGNGGYNISKEKTPYQEDWSRPEPIEDDKLVELLGGPEKWSSLSFVSMWQGWAAGYKYGYNQGEQAKLERVHGQDRAT